MHRYIRRDIPVLAVYNNLETFYPFLSRAHDPQVLNRRRYHGDRALFWLGDRKLVITTTAASLLNSMREMWGYPHTRFLSPKNPTYNLSIDILGDDELLDKVVEYAGPSKTLQIVPYATTIQFLQLAETLQEQYGLTVLLPESPAPNKLWLRDYIDTKTGFRMLANQWLSTIEGKLLRAKLPDGINCHNIDTAVGAASWFANQGKKSIIKADRGEAGLGQLILGNEDVSKVASLIAKNDFLGTDSILIEEYIHSPNQLSPSLEFFVPSLGFGVPEISHLANQIVRNNTQFCGAIISRESLSFPWYVQLANSGLLFARYLQEMGYVGHFDLDTIVDERGDTYLLEINSRRTGTTFVHEFAKYMLHPDYLDHKALLSNTLASGTIQDIETLLRVLSDVLFTPGISSCGVVVSNPSVLPFHEFGCIIVGSSSEEALCLQQDIIERVKGIRHVSPQLCYS